jgi:hypothetical protein
MSAPPFLPTTATDMIRADIATSALNEQVEQRVRIAASLLPAYMIRANVRPWDGTRCDLLITDLSDGYGRNTFALARKRGTPVLVVSDVGLESISDVPFVPANSPAPAYAQFMRELLSKEEHSETSTTNVSGEIPALCRLAEREFRGRPVDATLNGRSIRIRPDEGRVYATSLSDLLSARDSFISSPWELQVANTAGKNHFKDGANRSLEAFLLQSAYLGRQHLPTFPEGRFQLKDWPDVGSAPEFIGALKVARRLMRAPASASELRSACNMDETDIRASLWAYQASNLLSIPNGKDDAARPPAQPAAPFSGILARIASRFGLVNS